MANQQEEIVPNEHFDYADMLRPGYHFRPTDSEIIVYYLKPMIETGEYPECRLHQVNIYDHNPDVLAERYRPCDNKWYFLTPRERRSDKGNRPKRITKDLGRWKITQGYATVYDDVSGLPVGKKNSFVYEVGKNGKTPWLMHEYTTMNPNLPVGSGQDRKKLTDWVICKIYKKETNRSSSNNRAAHVQYMPNQEDQNKEQNQEHEKPSRKRQKVLPVNNQGINQPNCIEPQHIQVHKATHNDSRTHVQIEEPVQSVYGSNKQLANNITTSGGHMEFHNQTSYVNHDFGYNHNDTIHPMDTFRGSNVIQPDAYAQLPDYDFGDAILPMAIDQTIFRLQDVKNSYQDTQCSSNTSTAVHGGDLNEDDITSLSSIKVPSSEYEEIILLDKQFGPPRLTSLLPLTDPTDEIAKEPATKSFRLSDGASTSTLPVASGQPPDYNIMAMGQSPVTSRYIPQDVADHIPQPTDDYTGFFLDGENSSDVWKYISFDEV